MSQVINKDRLNNLANEIWKSAERLRGKFKAYEYQTVILPIIVIRRLECVLIKWREEQTEKLIKSQKNITEKELQKLCKQLELNHQRSPFSNKTNWTLRKIYEEDHTLMEQNFRDYINGFSDNVQEIIEHFNYRAVIGQMVKNARLAPILNQYSNLDLGADSLSNLEMGYIYEELLRRFSEQSGEEAGEHFTPREVIRLMVELMDIPIPEKHISIYDPACGTGGMLSVAKEHLFDKAKSDTERKNVENYVTVHGQELQPANYAICKADMLIKNDKNAEIYWGNSLIPHIQHSKDPGDQLASDKHNFDFMLSNPPFGVTWGGKDGYETEARKLQATRYKAGMPRTNDGALLFLQTMLAKIKPIEKGGSKIAIIFNGSPLSNGDCGSGESEIRRWILENDWLDAIVMLPDQLFYNTGIFTYIWLLTNNKPKTHKNKVLLIDARKQYEKEPKAFGNKRNRIIDEHRKWIKEQYKNGWKTDYKNDSVKLFNTTDFAFHKVSVVFWQTDEYDKPAYITEIFDKSLTPANIKSIQQFYDSDIEFKITGKSEKSVHKISFTLKPKDTFSKLYEREIKKVFEEEIKILVKNIKYNSYKNKLINKFINSLEITAEYTHRHYVTDNEYIKCGEDIETFLKREINKPVIRWQDSPQLGYEILPNKYFYKYTPPKPADEILNEFWELEKEAENYLLGVAKK